MMEKFRKNRKVNRHTCPSRRRSKTRQCHCEVLLDELSWNENQARFKKSVLLLSPEESQRDYAPRLTALDVAREVIVAVDGTQIRLVCFDSVAKAADHNMHNMLAVTPVRNSHWRHADFHVGNLRRQRKTWFSPTFGFPFLLVFESSQFRNITI